MKISSNKFFCLIDIFPSFTSSTDAVKIPAFPVRFKFLDFNVLLGNNSSIFIQSFNLPKNYLILLIPSSVVNTGSFGIFMLRNVFCICIEE